MKKTFLGILVSLFITQFTVAQTFEEDLPNNRWGVRGGLNFSKIDSDLGANTVRRRAIHAGVFYQWNVSDKFALQPELQYSSEGWIKEAPGGDTEAKIHFANVTVVGKFFLAGGFNFQAGIQPELMIEASEEGVGTFALDERLKRFNLGAVFGIGYDFGFGLRFGGRYVQGLIDINDGYNASTVENEIKTTTFQAYVGYSFSIPKSNGRSFEVQ